MAQLLKAIVVGGFNRHVAKINKDLKKHIEFVHVPTEGNFPNRLMPQAQAVIVLTRFASRQNLDGAKEVSRARKIPMITVDTSNYVLAELRRLKLVAEEKAEVEIAEPAPTVPEKGNEPESTTKIGMSLEELSQKYTTPLVEAVNTLLEPGEKIHIDDLLDSMASVVGIPEEDVRSLLPELASCGVIANTAGSTWKRLGKGVDFIDDKEEVFPKKRRYGTVMKAHAEKLRGLPEGPYESVYAIAREMEKFKDFEKADGTMPTRQHLSVIVRKAEELGFVTDVDGKKLIDHDDRVVLTPQPVQEVVEPAEPKKAAPKAKEPKSSDIKQDTKPKILEPIKQIEPPKVTPETNGKHAEEPSLHGIGTRFISLAALKPEEPKAAPVPVAVPSGNDLRAKAQLVGKIEIPMIQGTINSARKMLTEAYWDEMAIKAIERRLNKKGIEPIPIPKEVFSRNEWDALAWETVSNLPFGVVAMSFLEDLDFEDQTLRCRDCLKDFPFTADDQKHFQRIYGQVIPPARCRECRRQHVAERR